VQLLERLAVLLLDDREALLGGSGSVLGFASRIPLFPQAGEANCSIRATGFWTAGATRTPEGTKLALVLAALRRIT